MNALDTSDVGVALIRELAVELRKACFEQYSKEMSKLPLPQNVEALLDVHQQAKIASLAMFERNCTGGISSYDNIRAYSELSKLINSTFESHVSNNTYVAHMACSELVQSLFKPLREHAFASLEEFDDIARELSELFLIQAKGPLKIKEEILAKYTQNEVALKRELVLKDNSQSDFKHMVTSLSLIFLISFFGNTFVQPWNQELANLAATLYTMSALLILIITVVFHNMFEVQAFVQFTDLQVAFGMLKYLSKHFNEALKGLRPAFLWFASMLGPSRRYFIIGPLTLWIAYKLYKSAEPVVKYAAAKYRKVFPRVRTVIEESADMPPNELSNEGTLKTASKLQENIKSLFANEENVRLFAETLLEATTPSSKRTIPLPKTPSKKVKIAASPDAPVMFSPHTPVSQAFQSPRVSTPARNSNSTEMDWGKLVQSSPLMGSVHATPKMIPRLTPSSLQHGISPLTSDTPSTSFQLPSKRRRSLL